MTKLERQVIETAKRWARWPTWRMRFDSPQERKLWIAVRSLILDHSLDKKPKRKR